MTPLNGLKVVKVPDLLVIPVPTAKEWESGAIGDDTGQQYGKALIVEGITEAFALAILRELHEVKNRDISALRKFEAYHAVIQECTTRCRFVGCKTAEATTDWVDKHLVPAGDQIGKYTGIFGRREDQEIVAFRDTSGRLYIARPIEGSDLTDYHDEHGLEIDPTSIPTIS